jgi:methylthioribose-1-phosphate isomerase
MKIETITLKNDQLKIIDQTQLPTHLSYVEIKKLAEAVDAIKTLKVRGAPAIGILAAYALYIVAKNLYLKGKLTSDLFMNAAIELKETRPTAVNLEWAVNKMQQTFTNHFPKNNLVELLKKTAINIHQSDIESCKKIGLYGKKQLSGKHHFLTHCNAGALATGGQGTALSPIYELAKAQNVHVYVNETRPVGQGARLTYWELRHNEIPATLICDNMAGKLMAEKKIEAIITGADRIARNGDIANKIGTYSLAILAQYHHIPFYVAAPLSTFDQRIGNGNDIVIEQRDDEEIIRLWSIEKKMGYTCYNPAFDITPVSLVTGIITEKGIIEKPNANHISKLF